MMVDDPVPLLLKRFEECTMAIIWDECQQKYELCESLGINLRRQANVRYAKHVKLKYVKVFYTFIYLPCPVGF